MKFSITSSILISCLCLCNYVPLQVAGDDEGDYENGDAGPCLPSNHTSLRMTIPSKETRESIIDSAVSCTNNMALEFPCKMVDLQSFISTIDLNPNNYAVNDIWGWTDTQTNDEYAIIGLASGTVFVRISNPEKPLVVGFLKNEGSKLSDWGDSKTYGGYCFHVTEARETYLQIFDMHELRSLKGDVIADLMSTKVYDIFSSAHNIVINEDSGYAYAVGSNTCGGGLHIVDIRDPMNPKQAGCYSAKGYTHDAQCVNYNGPDTRYTNKEICFGYNENKVDIVDVTNKNNPTHISTYRYSGASYTHQGWLTEDQRYILIDDELDKGATEVFIADVSDLENPKTTGKYVSPLRNIDHNLYVKGNFVYQAQYTAGLRIYSLDDVSDGVLTEVAYFDTYPQNNDWLFEGAWSVYPFFDSGTVVVSSIEEGLFVLKPDLGSKTFSPSSSGTFSPSSSETFSPTSSSETFSPTSISDTYSPTSSSDTYSPTSSSDTYSPTSSSDTYSPTRDYQATPLSWHIELWNDPTIFDMSGLQGIMIRYLISDRKYDVVVLKEDCKTVSSYQFNKNINDLPESEHFRFLKVHLYIDQAKLKASDLWESNGNGGSFKFCLSPRLQVRKDDKYTIVTRKDLLFHVGVSNLVSFNVDDIEVIIPQIEENDDLSINYQGEVYAFQCDSDSKKPVDSSVSIEPGDVLYVCIKVTDDDNVIVTSIKDLSLKQDTGATFDAIVDGSVAAGADDLVVKDECKDGVCLAMVQVINAFFLGDKPSPLTVTGKVFLGGAKSRRLVRLNEDGDPFSLKIDLGGKPCDTGGVFSAVKKGLRLN